jgi:hypothetical protein
MRLLSDGFQQGFPAGARQPLKQEVLLSVQ